MTLACGLEWNTPTSDTVLKERNASLTPIILGVASLQGNFTLKKLSVKWGDLGGGGDKLRQFNKKGP